MDNYIAGIDMQKDGFHIFIENVKKRLSDKTGVPIELLNTDSHITVGYESRAAYYFKASQKINRELKQSMLNIRNQFYIDWLEEMGEFDK